MASQVCITLSHLPEGLRGSFCHFGYIDRNAESESFAACDHAAKMVHLL